MKIGYLKLMSKTLDIIRADKIILAPCLLFAFFVQIVENQFGSILNKAITFNQFAIKYLTLNWILDLAVMGITIVGAIQLYQTRPLHLGQTIKEGVNWLGQLLVGTCVYIIPSGYIIYEVSKSEIEKVPPFLMVGMMILVGISFCLMFVPVMVLYHKENGVLAMKRSYRFVKSMFRYVFIYLSLVICINMLSFLIGAIMINIPILGKSFFFVGIQGLGYSIIYILNVVFYLEFESSKPKLSSEISNEQ